MATWEGDLEHDPTRNDGISTCFNARHGSDTVILAGLMGYYARLRKPESEIARTFLTAGETLLAEEIDMNLYYSVQTSHLMHIANGEPFPLYDLPEQGLSCLIPPIPAQPGIIEEKGGTAFYTNTDSDQEQRLVVASHMPNGERNNAHIAETAIFTEADIPIMAKLVCNLALGEYRREIKGFLTHRFFPAEVAKE